MHKGEGTTCRQVEEREGFSACLSLHVCEPVDARLQQHSTLNPLHQHGLTCLLEGSSEAGLHV